MKSPICIRFVSCLLLLLVRDVSSRLVKRGGAQQLRQHIKQQQYASAVSHEQQQQHEFEHRKLVKLHGKDEDRMDGHYIVVLHEHEDVDDVIRNHQTNNPGSMWVQHIYRHATNGFAVEVFSHHALQALLDDARVKEVAEDGKVYTEQDEDPGASEAPPVEEQSEAPANLDRIDQQTGTDSSFRHRYSGRGQIVHVVDTGIRSTHEDFMKEKEGEDGTITSSSRVREECFSAFKGVSCHDDPFGHGTHVASIVGGKRWGVAKEIELVSVRVFDTEGVATWSSFTAGIDYCTEAQKNATQNIIVNMSMGGPKNPTFDKAVRVLLTEGAIVVAAAGNQNSPSCSRSPPNALGVIGVGNSALTDTRDLNSNFGPCVDIWAPGVDVKAASSVCDSGDYCWKTLTGTSMASALVSGAYGLYLEAKAALEEAGAITPETADEFTPPTRRQVARAIKKKLLADATIIDDLDVNGSAKKLLCIAPLNNVEGEVPVAAGSTPAGTTPAGGAAAPIAAGQGSTETGMVTESIGGEGETGYDGMMEIADEKPATPKKPAKTPAQAKKPDQVKKPEKKSATPAFGEGDKKLAVPPPAKAEKKPDKKP